MMGAKSILSVGQIELQKRNGSMQDEGAKGIQTQR